MHCLSRLSYSHSILPPSPAECDCITNIYFLCVSSSLAIVPRQNIPEDIMTIVAIGRFPLNFGDSCRLLSHFVMRGKGGKGQFSNQIYMIHMWYHHKFLIHVLEWDSWIFLSNQSIVSFLHQRQGLFCSCSHENREQNSNLNGRAASHLMLEQTNQRSYDRCWFAKKQKKYQRS